jgi:hypothetical protein
MNFISPERRMIEGIEVECLISMKLFYTGLKEVEAKMPEGFSLWLAFIFAMRNLKALVTMILERVQCFFNSYRQ